MIYAGALPPATVKTILNLTMGTPLDQDTNTANYKVLGQASKLTLEYCLGLWKRTRKARIAHLAIIQPKQTRSNYFSLLEEEGDENEIPTTVNPQPPHPTNPTQPHVATPTSSPVRKKNKNITMHNSTYTSTANDDSDSDTELGAAPPSPGRTSLNSPTEGKPCS